VKMKHVGPAILAMGLLVAACGDDSGSKAAPAVTTVAASATTAPTTSPVTDAPTTAAPAAATGAGTVTLADNAKVGEKILVDGKGMTLYLFEKDQGTTTACTGGCAKAWPPFTGTATAGDGIDASKLGSANGQVTYNGHLLYYFAADKAAGDANGVGLPSWYPLGADGNKIDKS
jgi:predicted lipoprotein with Yx(FWY)xxD motif